VNLRYVSFFIKLLLYCIVLYCLRFKQFGNHLASESTSFPSLPVPSCASPTLLPVSSHQRNEATFLKRARGSGEALYSPELQRGSEQSPAAFAFCCIVCSQHFWFFFLQHFLFFRQHCNEWQNEIQSRLRSNLVSHHRRI